MEGIMGVGEIGEWGWKKVNGIHDQHILHAEPCVRSEVGGVLEVCSLTSSRSGAEDSLSGQDRCDR